MRTFVPRDEVDKAIEKLRADLKEFLDDPGFPGLIARLQSDIMPAFYYSLYSECFERQKTPKEIGYALGLVLAIMARAYAQTTDCKEGVDFIRSVFLSSLDPENDWKFSSETLEGKKPQ